MSDPNFTEIMNAEHGDIGVATIATPDEPTEIDPNPTPVIYQEPGESGREYIRYKYDRTVGRTNDGIEFDFGGYCKWLPRSRIAIDFANDIVLVETWLAEKELGNLKPAEDDESDV